MESLRKSARNGDARVEWSGEIDLDRFDTRYLPGPRARSHASQNGIPIMRFGEALWIAVDAIEPATIRYWRRHAATLYWIKASPGAINRLKDRLAADEEQRPVERHQRIADAPSVTQWVADTIDRATSQTASDIHFEPFERRFRVRVRVDGVLHTLVEPSVELMPPAIAHLKIMAGLDTAERRLPQDGRTTHRHHDLRISTLPTMYGEKVVARVLAAAERPLAIDQLGLFGPQRETFLAALARPQGMVLVTGPTGSGKTATLYAALNYLNEVGRNLATVEDPIEIKVDGINQVQVDDRIGMSFARALRALLRQDPDVLMVGEVRDRETADIAVKAAQTGHLVLATLHSNGAADAFTRLRGLGVAEVDVRECVTLVVAQRLIRLLCPRCKIREDAHETESAISEQHVPRFVANESGCRECFSGYRHRRGIYELATHGAESGERLTLHESGLARVRRGETSLAELDRVLGADGPK